jgi:hypothetical protein
MAIDPNIPLQAGAGAAAPQNPLAQFGNVVNIANAMGQNKLQGVQTQAAEQGLGQTRLRALGAIAGTALSVYDPANPASANGVVDALYMGIESAVANGTLDQNTAQQLFKGIAATKSPDDLIGRVKQFALLGIDPNAALTRVYGQGGTISNGQEVQPGVVRDPMFGGGFTPAGQGVPQFPSRSELIGRVPGPPGPGGAPTTVPLGAVTPPALGGPAASSLGDGRFPHALRNPANPAAPPLASSTGQVTTGLGPAQSSAQAATGAQGAARFSQIADQGVAAQAQDAILGNMETEIAQFASGTGQDRIKNFQKATLRFAPGVARAFGIDEKSVAANESFDKLAAQIADAQGAGSDARLAVTQSANPGSTLTPEGARLILSQLRGNADYNKARATLAANWPDKADQAGFEQQAKNLDPRAFQMLRMTPEQQRTFFTNLNAADKASVKKAWTWATEQGLVGR